MKLGPLFNEPYVLTSPFNAPRNYSAFGGKVNDKHEGVDFDVTTTGDSKASVLCTYAGVVASVRNTGGYGQHVKVEHERNGSTFFTWYAHFDAVYVSAGQSVAMGTPLGEIGDSGFVSGEHVHFTLQVPGYGLDGYIVADVVDPLPYF